MANQQLPGGAAGHELQKTLLPGEPVLGYASGKGGIMLVATDRRAIVIKAGAVATGRWGGHEVNSFGYQQITSTEMRGGLMDGYVEISTGGVQNRQPGRLGQMKASNIVPYNRPSEGAFRAVVEVIRQHLYAAPGQPAPNAQPAAAPSIPQQIAELAQLRDAGVLSPAEFEAKKAELLARM
jgi:hypothetical protein